MLRKYSAAGSLLCMLIKIVSGSQKLSFSPLSHSNRLVDALRYNNYFICNPSYSEIECCLEVGEYIFIKNLAVSSLEENQSEQNQQGMVITNGAVSESKYYSVIADIEKLVLKPSEIKTLEKCRVIINFLDTLNGTNNDLDEMKETAKEYTEEIKEQSIKTIKHLKDFLNMEICNFQRQYLSKNNAALQNNPALPTFYSEISLFRLLYTSVLYDETIQLIEKGANSKERTGLLEIKKDLGILAKIEKADSSKWMNHQGFIKLANSLQFKSSKLSDCFNAFLEHSKKPFFARYASRNKFLDVAFSLIDTLDNINSAHYALMNYTEVWNYPMTVERIPLEDRMGRKLIAIKYRQANGEMASKMIFVNQNGFEKAINARKIADIEDLVAQSTTLSY